MLFILTPLWLAIWAGIDLARPARRDLQPYHREFLAHPQNHGVRVEPFTTRDGTPCLLTIPNGSLGKRGHILRSQLNERGVRLPKSGQTIGTIVLIHGRNGRKEDYLPVAERFCSVGFRCLMPDMPAHGENKKPTASYGVKEAQIPLNSLQEAAVRFGFPMEPAALLGISMGGSIAVHATQHQPSPWKALVVISSFDSLPAVAVHHSRRMNFAGLGPASLPVSSYFYQILSGTKFEDIKPSQHMRSVSIPTFIAHGDKDQTVPIESGRRLYQSLPPSTTKHWLEVPGAGHNNILITDYPIYADIAEWFLRHIATQR